MSITLSFKVEQDHIKIRSTATSQEDIMVEQITINPEEVRGYGNVLGEHELLDFRNVESSISKVSDTVDGALTSVYRLMYSLYGFVFDFDEGAKQIYLQVEQTDTLELGFENKELYLLNDTEETVDFDFDSTTKELYIEIGDQENMSERYNVPASDVLGDNYKITNIVCSDYNPNIDSTITVTVSVNDVFGYDEVPYQNYRCIYNYIFENYSYEDIMKLLNSDLEMINDIRANVMSEEKKGIF